MTFEASRSKQVLILQPRGKPLYEDGKTSFGLKMLESMGWKKGNGLGKNQQGNLDFIQVRYKNNSSGIGFDRLKDNQWTDTEHNFNALLQNLNSNSNSNSNDEDSNEATRTKSSVKSLEEMSKQSRARVHYKKFTKGKDVYKYSEKDLANIFGKKSLNESEKVVIEQPEPEEDKPDQYASNLIVNTGISITDYFKQKRKRDSVEAPPEDVTEKPKKKKKKLVDEQQLEVTENEVSKSIEEPNNSQSSEDVKHKKKKKKLGDEEQLEVTENQNQEELKIVEEPIENQSSEDVKPKKKKKKNKIEEQPEPSQIINEEPQDVVKPKKKKNKASEQNVTEKPSEEPQESNEPEKVKKKEKESQATQSEQPTPSKTNDEERPRGANAIYSTDIIQIPTYVAQKMAKMTVNHFSSANLGNIVGYGMSEDIEIKVIQTKLGDTSLSTDKYTLYNMDKVVKTKVNPRKILSKIKRTKKSIQVI